MTVRTCLVATLALAMAGAAQAREYSLVIDDARVSVAGRSAEGMLINGQLPGPTLRFTEGEEAVIHVRNDSDAPTSLHWHGLLVPAAMDGAPGFSGFRAIEPGETFTYRFPIRQHGTYWYHSHSGGQEQMGLYAPLIIDPATPEANPPDRDYVVFLSDFTTEHPDRILNNLKVDAGYYNNNHRTIGDFFRDARAFGLGRALRDRATWGQMRMDPTDIADVTNYTFLINGRPAAENETFLFRAGERVRLRLINGSAMSYFDFRIPGLKLTIVSADGRAVDPVEVDELRIAVAETYDIVVEPREAIAYTVFAEAMDRSGYARGTLAPRAGMEAPIPEMRPRAILTMADMGMSHGAPPPQPSAEHGQMDHGQMDHGAGGHTAMDHDMGDALGAEGGVDGSGRTFGWGSEFPADARVLSYADLASATPQADTRAAGRDIVVRLTGAMERYVWTLNGQPMHDAEPINLDYGERVRLVFVNETMMAHPMHLHGMFVQLENGMPTERLPDKHIVSVAPGQTYSVLLTADEPGEWAFHCHLLYHMASGMMNRVVVARREPRPVASADDSPHGRH
ncbi:MAG: copper resistance system multicopper oxidase [Hyphomonadaceae bacterium]|nr:copper resistance system multicopper oxidase [Hyphomonadaceae bacterium]